MSVRAVVKVSVSVSCGSRWDESTNFKQVKKQAIEDAEEILRKFFNASGGMVTQKGKMEVTLVSTDI